MKKLFKNLEEITSSIFMMVTLILVLLNIFTRYFLKTGIPWSEEVATGCFVWTVYIGAAAAYKRGQHIGIDLIVKYLNGKNRDIVQIIVDLILLVVMIFLTILSIKYVQTTYKKPTPVLAISSAYISSAIVIGFVLMTLRTIQILFKDTKKLKGGSI
ncbi:TRAP transporter small permease [Peptoniphilus mikwangii]|uniref:TRAP transporter small permease n=1 Tax=Peptoniphilus mikwangii TaxID=1354300 RepID=UPI0004035FD7|nr:TRAP transporter small permease [Peptoniphilus mikwangii]